MSSVSFAELIPHLKSLSLAFEQKSHAVSSGNHPGVRKGFEDERLEFRNYVAGDDLRYLDWRLMAKTDKLYIREGYQKARQSVCLHFDDSVSHQFLEEKFETAWLCFLSLAYLFRKKQDKVFLSLSNISEKLNLGHEPILRVKNTSQLIEVNKRFSQVKSKFSFKKKNKSVEKNWQRELEQWRQIVEVMPVHGKIIWITDLYFPLENFKKILQFSSQKKLQLSVFHFIKNKENDPDIKTKGFLNRVIDVETGDWISANRFNDYSKIWEEAVKSRINLIMARKGRYVRANAEDGPLKVLAQLKEL